MMEARSMLDKCRQQDRESNAAFLDQFKAVGKSYGHSRRSIGDDDGLLVELEGTNDIDHPGEIPKGREWITKYLTVRKS